MRPWGIWLAATLVLAAAIHVAAVRATPAFVNFVWLTMLDWNGLKSNDLVHAMKPKPQGRDVVGYDNPDNVSSFIIYDVSEAPLRVRARVVREAPYWSLSFVDYETDVFALIRDKDVEGDVVTIVLAREGADYKAQEGERVVTAPTDKGVVLFRMIVPDRMDLATVQRLAAVKAESTAEVVSAP